MPREFVPLGFLEWTKTWLWRYGDVYTVIWKYDDQQVSMEAMIQRGRSPGEAVPVVLTTHETEEAAMRRALAHIGALSTVLEPPRMIRIESL